MDPTQGTRNGSPRIVRLDSLPVGRMYPILLLEHMIIENETSVALTLAKEIDRIAHVLLPIRPVPNQSQLRLIKKFYFVVLFIGVLTSLIFMFLILSSGHSLCK